MKIKNYIIIFICAILLSGCGVIDISVKEQIVAPENNIPPILGKWEISDIRYKSNLSDLDIFNKIGQLSLFHKNAIVVGSDYSSSPEYKIKKVNTKDYFTYKYKLDASNFGLQDEFIKVVTIYNEKQIFKEFIIIDEDNMMIYDEDTFYNMKRILAEVSEEEVARYINVEETIQRSFSISDSLNINSGILLGLKVQKFDEGNKVPTWDYKTLWININSKSSTNIYELDRLLVPRRSGFWFVDSERIVESNSLNDVIRANALLKEDTKYEKEEINKKSDYKSNTTSEFQNPKLPSVLKNILFVGNDYISLESIDLDRNDKRSLLIHTIDNLSEKKPVKLSDLIGEEGKNLFQEAASGTISFKNDIVANEENVSLYRKNGYWTLKGRINYKENNEELYRDFNIKALPPKEMVSYDDLSLPWDALVLAVPDVVDVFSSPNSDILVIITKDSILIHSLEEYDIDKIPIGKISLPQDSTIIMSEWAVGRYPSIWEDTMIKNGASEIELE